MRVEFNLPRIESIGCQHLWSAEHAAKVHNGATSLDGEVLPARPWIDVTLNEVDPVALIAQYCKSGAAIDIAFRSAMDDLGDLFGEVLDSYVWDIPSRGRKQFRSGPTWRTISDSQELKNSYSRSYY
jgi:hypothetical protein